MSDESTLRQKAREAIRAGKLPNRSADGTWGGPGADAECSVCGVPVKREELEFEIEFARGDADQAADKHHLHVRCFEAWEAERETVGQATSATTSGQCAPSAPAAHMAEGAYGQIEALS